MYGSENWSLNRSDKRKVEAAEMLHINENPTTDHRLN